MKSKRKNRVNGFSKNWGYRPIFYEIWFLYWLTRSALFVVLGEMLRHRKIWGDSYPDLRDFKVDNALIRKSRRTGKPQYRYFTTTQSRIRDRAFHRFIEAESRSILLKLSSEYPDLCEYIIRNHPDAKRILEGEK